MELLFKLTVVLTVLPSCLSAAIPDNGLYDFVMTLSKRTDVLETNNKALSVENEGLKAEMLNQQEEIKRLAVMSEEQNKINERLEERLTKLEENGEPDIDNMELSLRSYDINKAPAIARIRKASNEVPVAFFATLTNNIQSSSANEGIRFDHVITNVGYGYNQNTGNFRAPVSGIYVFSTMLWAGSRGVHYQIMLNGSPVAKLYIGQGSTTTQDAVLHLNQGDSVFVQIRDASTLLYGIGYTSFSGFLLH